MKPGKPTSAPRSAFGVGVLRCVRGSLKRFVALATICVIAVVFGLDSIFTFAMPLMVGMISGVYTSLCLTTSLWVLWEGKRPNKTNHTAR